MARKRVEYGSHSFDLSYDLQNPGLDKALLFLHGWGSNKELMKQAFGHCFENHTHIYLDLPGFGKSDAPTVLTTDDYAAIVKAFLQTQSYTLEAIFGHSFGGKVATLLSPDKLVLLSSAGIVEPKPLSVRLKVALFKLLKPFGGAKLRSLFASGDVEGMGETMYATFKNVVNEDFTPKFRAFKGQALIFWGTEDRATSLQSGETIAKLMKNSRFYPMDGDHYFFLNRGKMIETTYLT